MQLLKQIGMALLALASLVIVFLVAVMIGDSVARNSRRSYYRGW